MNKRSKEMSHAITCSRRNEHKASPRWESSRVTGPAGVGRGGQRGPRGAPQLEVSHLERCFQLGLLNLSASWDLAVAPGQGPC